MGKRPRRLLAHHNGKKKNMRIVLLLEKERTAKNVRTNKEDGIMKLPTLKGCASFFLFSRRFFFSCPLTTTRDVQVPSGGVPKQQLQNM